MRKIFICLAAMAMLCVVPATPVLADDDNQNRYEVYTAQVQDFNGRSNPVAVMLDKKTGRTWYLAGALEWRPMTIYHKKSQEYHDAMIESGGSYLPPKE